MDAKNTKASTHCFHVVSVLFDVGVAPSVRDPVRWRKAKGEASV
jgi:hypothetical protein